MEKEAKFYLLMMTLQNIALSLSNVFVNVFLWKMNHSISLLAVYSLMSSVAIIVSFPLCAMYARKRSPMSSTRVGILLFILTYGIILVLKDNTADSIYLIGGLLGLAISFFAIGQHMQTMDSTDNGNRDRFLYISNFLVSISGMIAPLFAGLIIKYFHRFDGYYLVFGISFAVFILTMAVSFQIKGKAVSTQSHIREVWRNKHRVWRGMYWVSMGASMVEGTYITFLVTVMIFSILKGELAFGGYNAFVAIMGLVSSVILAKISKPERRLPIYLAGASLVCVTSVAMSVYPGLVSLVFYTVFCSIGINLVNTTLSVWTYEAIETDRSYKERRLDYIVIREIPLGLGRMVGIALFFILKDFFSAQVMPIAFAVFGSFYFMLYPVLRNIWRRNPPASESAKVSSLHNLK